MAVDGAGATIRPPTSDHGPVTDPSFARILVQSALLHLAHGQTKQAQILTSKLAGTSVYEQAFTDVVNRHFFIKNYEFPARITMEPIHIQA